VATETGTASSKTTTQNAATTAVTAASALARLKAMTTITLGGATKTTWPASTQTPLASTMTTLPLKWWNTVNGLPVSEMVTATMGTTKQSAVTTAVTAASAHAW
ncbi:unnamed protein product, partial [Ectocarpus sp. 12 AP-2014]